MHIDISEYNAFMFNYAALLEMSANAVGTSYLIETYSITTMDDKHVFLCHIVIAHDGEVICPQQLVIENWEAQHEMAFKFDTAKECLAFAHAETQRLTNLVLERVGEFTA